MCGRYSLTSPPEAVRRLFNYPGQPNLGPRYNIAPTQAVAVVRRHDGQEVPELAMLRWGLVASWSREIRAAPLINARAETLLQKPSFRAAARRRRCLIPANGYYEWRTRAGAKQPFLITLDGGALMAFAGIWERWRAPDGTALESAAIVTTGANPALAPIHNRMPLMIDPGDHARWLDPEAEPPEAVLAGLVGIDPARFDAVAVSTHVNHVGHDDPRCIEPVPEGLL